MPKLATRSLTGKSGKSYLFNVYKGNMRFNDFIPGVYYISTESAGNEKAVFLGESDNVEVKLQNHELQSTFDEHQYNRISFYKNASREIREAIVEDLMPVLEPVAN
jgi:hypothetical protein